MYFVTTLFSKIVGVGGVIKPKILYVCWSFFTGKVATLRGRASKWPFSLYRVGKNPISQGVEDWGSLISVPQGPQSSFSCLISVQLKDSAVGPSRLDFSRPARTAAHPLAGRHRLPQTPAPALHWKRPEQTKQISNPKTSSRFFGQKNPRVRKILVRNSGAGDGCTNFMGARKKCALSAGKPCP